MIEIFWAELRRQWIQQRRFAIDSIAGILGIAVAFYGFFLTTQYAAGPATQFGDRLDAIAGYQRLVCQPRNHDQRRGLRPLRLVYRGLSH